MAASKIKSPISVSVFVVFGLILLSLHLMSSATLSSSDLGGVYSWLLLINSLGSLLMLVLIGANIHSLVKQFRKRKAGSRLTARMMFLFVLLSLAPASIVYYYSMEFLHRNIDSWFDVQIDQAMEDALELSNAALDQQTRNLLKTTATMAKSLLIVPDDSIAFDLGEKRERSGATELTLISKQGRIIASSSVIPDLIIPSMPSEHILLNVRQGKTYVGLDPVLDEGMQIRVVVPVLSAEPRYLQALYPVQSRISALIQSVESAYAHYKGMSYLRSSLKLSFALTLSLVLLLSLLFAIWAAFVSVRRIVAPVRDLVRGTRAIAAGNYEQRLPIVSNDELGFLVESFNHMSEQIARARDEAFTSQLEVENQRAYLETLLGNLTSGVLSFDKEMNLRTANHAANKILNINVSAYAGKPLSALTEENPNLVNLITILQQKLDSAYSLWQEEATFLGPNGRQELLCRGTPLFSVNGRRSGAVMVFDDMTDLIKAQRNAAWGGVAQRLAHEIKNPLTPIQLSAERLVHKLANKLEKMDARMLEKATKTIVVQVEALKMMVDAFSDYARPPRIQPEKLDLNVLIEEVLVLYPPQPGLSFARSLDAEMPYVEVDPVRMRQVLHNLIKNAQEAIDPSMDGRIALSTRCIQEHGSTFVEIQLSDNGPGIELEHVDSVFEPYTTTKTKGTGLGLAIVKKIIEEHGGIIWIDPEFSNGARFFIRLPVAGDNPKLISYGRNGNDRRQLA